MLNPNIKILNPNIPNSKLSLSSTASALGFPASEAKQKKTTLISKAQLIVLDFNNLDFEFVWDLDIGILNLFFD